MEYLSFFRASEEDLDNKDKFFLLHWAAVIVCYYCHGMFYVAADRYGFLDAWAIRSGKKRLPSDEQQFKAIKLATVDTFLIKPVLLYFGFPYVFEQFLGFNEDVSNITHIKEVLLMLAIFSFSFYCIHAGLHKVKYLYKTVHKVHHSYHESVGFAAQFAHPIEELTNAFHLVIAMILVRPHYISNCIFLGIQIFEIVDAHSGYSVPWRFLYPWSDVWPCGAGARMHDFHHSHNIGNYGGGLIGFDRLFGTDVDFKKHETSRLDKSK